MEQTVTTGDRAVGNHEYCTKNDRETDDESASSMHSATDPSSRRGYLTSIGFTFSHCRPKRTKLVAVLACVSDTIVYFIYHYFIVKIIYTPVN